MTVHEMRQRLEELGTDKTQPLYQRPWAMASDTPFRFYKLWPYRGGVQTPFIVSWPAEIRAHGLRRQFVDMIDITPTVLDIADVEAPPVFEGVCEIPLQGVNLASQYPEKLDEMKKLWWSEAAANGALPLLEAPRTRRNTYDQALQN